MSTTATFASEILAQLGGSKFIAMTGSSNFLFAEVTESNPIPWLRMNLSRNSGKVNRLKVYLNDNDTYTMEFYMQKIKGVEVDISNKKSFEGVYCDMLQSIFTKVTGLHASL